MGVVRNMIIVEDRFEELFNELPPFANIENGNNFYPVFKFGDNLELLSFLKQNEGNESPYPLIWLVYPYEEQHNRTNVSINNLSLVLAVETNAEMFNEERFKTTYRNFLFPLFERIKKLFELANIIDTNNEFMVIKFPNYSGSEIGEENETVDIWDALKITFDCKINNRCLNKIIF